MARADTESPTIAARRDAWRRERLLMETRQEKHSPKGGREIRHWREGKQSARMVSITKIS